MVARGSGEGFRFGTTTGEPLPPAYAAGIPELEPEKNTTIELGYKGILANKVFLDVSGYRSRYRNFISPLRLIGNPSAGVFVLDEKGIPREGELTVTYLNFGEQVVWGLDLGVNVYASERVTLKGNASFIEADDLQAPEGFDQSFNTPATTFNAVLSASDLPIRGSTVDLSVRRVSEFDFRTAAHVGTVPAYAIFDFNLGYQMRHGVTYRLTVKNLFDNDHIEMVDGPKIGRLVVAEIEYAF
ncbi:MAG: TonB-dependent receptor [Candidatus Latescibacteria bacterium]|nr:TonB-dependent receptor [Candidatus Latescibacterota bacterium]